MLSRWAPLMLLAACRLHFDELGGSDAASTVTDDSLEVRSDVNLVFVTDAETSALQVLTRGGGDILAGGDAICADAATAGGLPGRYVALLSTDTTSALSRLAGSRGWYRLDGLPFGDTPSSMFVDRQIFYPVLYTEYGVARPTIEVITGTGDLGTADRNCTNWTNLVAPNELYVGNSSDGSVGWATANVPACDAANLHLYCFGVGHDAPVTVEPVAGRRAFVSLPFSPGGGLTAADMQCQQEANVLDPPGTFIALLGANNEPPSIRLPRTGAAWVRLDGVALAVSPQEFIAAHMLAALTLRADGVSHYDGLIWTGAGGVSTIVAPARDCNTWSATGMSQTAYQGRASGGPFRFFSQSSESSCNTAYPMFCLEI